MPANAGKIRAATAAASAARLLIFFSRAAAIPLRALIRDLAAKSRGGDVSRPG